ncbi:hypothetical protein L208DRAFT_1497650 [Tricholoma matsutake]|nr:hypothetical protein L208DRAFT_1497650 [Tricholoma matsutake 945]
MLFANSGDIFIYVFFCCASPAHALYLAGLPQWHSTHHSKDVSDYIRVKH